MSTIEWTDATWNPTVGCTRVSKGCEGCYAEKFAVRLQAQGIKGYEGVVDSHGRWTGRVNVVEGKLLAPLRWRKPRMVFVDSMSDLFHEKVSDETLDKVFAVMAMASQHTFQVLTKRPARMADYFSVEEDELRRRWYLACADLPPELNTFAVIGTFRNVDGPLKLPLSNVWLGVSVEDHMSAFERVPLLAKVPAAVRFVSYEPALGGISWRSLGDPALLLDWIIYGGESGPGCRLTLEDWALLTRDFCQQEGIPFFFKQWGGFPKKKAGRVLDGRTWDEMPSPYAKASEDRAGCG